MPRADEKRRGRGGERQTALPIVCTKTVGGQTLGDESQPAPLPFGCKEDGADGWTDPDPKVGPRDANLISELQI